VRVYCNNICFSKLKLRREDRYAASNTLASQNPLANLADFSVRNSAPSGQLLEAEILLRNAWSLVQITLQLTFGQSFVQYVLASKPSYGARPDFPVRRNELRTLSHVTSGLSCAQCLAPSDTVIQLTVNVLS
jgi:hypothetical protein